MFRIIDHSLSSDPEMITSTNFTIAASYLQLIPSQCIPFADQTTKKEDKQWNDMFKLQGLKVKTALVDRDHSQSSKLRFVVLHTSYCNIIVSTITKFKSDRNCSLQSDGIILRYDCNRNLKR